MGKLIDKYRTLGPELFWKKLIGYEVAFTCAIRKKTNPPLYQGDCKNPFNLIPESKEYWYADPLMFEWKGKTWLFMEAFSYKKQKGEIVCTEIKESRCTDIKTVIEEPYHLSFPNVFYHNEDIFMIPETEASGGITLYKCISFPYTWECVQRIQTDMPVVDCVLDHVRGNKLYFLASTFPRGMEKQSAYIRFTIEMDNENNNSILSNSKIADIHFYKENQKFSFENRNAGRFIPTEDTIIHCVQTSTPAIYGYSLKFFNSAEGTNEWNNDLGEPLEIGPKDIRLSGWKGSKKWIGVHTYDCTEEYEVIDVEYLRLDPLKWVKRVYSKFH